MKTLFVLGTALALTACGQRTDTATDATPSPANTMVAAPAPATQAATGNMAGKYEMTAADGTVTTQTVNPDGTFSQIAKGKETSGTWRMNGAQSCFDPAGDAVEACYTTTAPGADGSFKTTGPDGSTMTVRKVAAAPAM